VTAEPIPKHVVTFVHEHINSVVELEALLLLYQTRPRTWTASEIARELRIDASWPQTELQQLCRAGIIRCTPANDPTYEFAGNADIENIVGDLSATYTDRRVSVIGLIFSKPLDKLKSFGDAFRIRKDPGNG
jgi:hypothetical protein